MIDYIDTKRIQKLSNEDSSVPLYQKVIKLNEESGELSQAFLKYDGSKNTSGSAQGKVEDVLEETCDVINVAADIINALTKDNPTLEQYTQNLFQKKLDKWESKQKQYSISKNDFENISEEPQDKLNLIYNKNEVVEDFISECLNQDLEYEHIFDYINKKHKG